MNTTTTTVTRKNKLQTWQFLVTIESEPVSLDDLSGRWLDSVGRDQVMSAHKIRVMANDVKYPHPNPSSTPGYEILFKCGARGFVLDRGPKNGGQELDALIVGTKGYLHGLAVWKKYGQTRGHCVGWFSAQRAVRGLQNPNTAPRCCAAELYARAAGKPW